MRTLLMQLSVIAAYWLLYSNTPPPQLSIPEPGPYVPRCQNLFPLMLCPVVAGALVEAP